jgi:Uri superfamily endonuclease
MSSTNLLYRNQQTYALPRSGGIYILHLHLIQPRVLRIGKLGEYYFQPGEYLYVGSAQGPGGLKARLGRHLHGYGRCHWHIDWLRLATSVSGYFYLETRERIECKWSQFLMQAPKARIPVPGFGASDCRSKGNSCAAHLVRLDQSIDVNKIRGGLPKDKESQVVYRKNTSQFRPDRGDIE